MNNLYYKGNTLDEEIFDYIGNFNWHTTEHEIDIATVCEDDMIEMCKHFANWSKERIISEAVQWLEKNADAHT